MADDQFQTSESAAPTTPMLNPEQPKLIVLEGIDLSGRTTQVHLLHDWLVAQHYHVTTTAWRTSPLISDVLARARTGPPLQPLTYSLLFCADHIDRTQRVIKPALARGEIVLADRYTYTAFARDAARGLDPAWIRNLYHFSAQPGVVFYLHISPEEAVKRRLALQQRHDSAKMEKEKPGKSTKEYKQHKPREKGQVQSAPTTAPLLAGEALESFRNFENRMYSEYQQMQKEFGFRVIEGDESIDHVQAMLRRAITQLLLNIGSRTKEEA
jgi:dTMP kinase